jgi:cytochrome c553
MATFMTTLSKEDIRVIAEYYGAQSPKLATAKRRNWWFMN